MSDPAISVEQIGKRYQLGARERGYTTLRETVVGIAAAPLRRMRELAGTWAQAEYVWACRDISFEVQPGEVLGIIGRNGAGKSTLLKIISRITEPTAGRVVFRGRVGSLLEVGTGFHPELTGRENIFLNGAILGMGRAEVRRKFDAIVDFSEIEQFLDTPVKRYSSGMYMRLAFAVAAHLEPEILVVDEVLAVGDQLFQRKCLGKMDEISKQGRTVLFVSHSMLAVQRLCTRALLLDRGRLVMDGPVPQVAAHYLNDSSQTAYSFSGTRTTPHFVSAGFETDVDDSVTLFTDVPLILDVVWRVPAHCPGLRVGLGVNSSQGMRIFGSAPEDCGWDSPTKAGTYRARIRIPSDVLLAGQYSLALCLWDGARAYDYPDPACSFRVEPGPSLAYARDSRRDGVVQVRCDWELSSDVVAMTSEPVSS